MNVAATLLITKAAAQLSRLTGRGRGHALPGLVAEHLDPDLAKKLAAGLAGGVVLVTGTNGKTTTTKFARAMLEAGGERVLTNSTGSNLKRGVTSALIAASDWRGRVLPYTMALFEVDEASLPAVAEALQPRAIVVLNLFRDQLDRYGELDTTASMLGQGIVRTDARLFLNADDPLVASLARYAVDPASVSFFGIEAVPAGKLATDTVADSDRCPICHDRLDYSRVIYSHIGHYRCPRGHFSRPHPGVVVTGVRSSGRAEGTEFTLAIDSRRFEASIPLPGTYNLYNAIAAVALAHGLGLDDRKIVETLTTVSAAFGRVEAIEYKGRRIYLLLIKNPAGFSQILETFLTGQSEPEVMFAINDLAADGRDVSWLWDVPVEALVQWRPESICSGIRAYDMALRLHYGGMESEVVADLEAALHKLIERTPEGGTAYILPTYTAMLAIRKLLSNLTQIPEIES